jgi:hypothetical protein
MALEARHRVDSENTESVSMDVLYFLKERTRLIRDYYEHAARPLNCTRKAAMPLDYAKAPCRSRNGRGWWKHG